MTPNERETLADGGISFLLDTDEEHVKYSFVGYSRAMGHWHIPTSSLAKIVDGEKVAEIDALAFYLEIQKLIEVEPFTLTRFLDETYKTLYADAFILAKTNTPVKQLIDQDSQTIEHHMKGHPWATVNKGRNGFNINDHEKFSPEANRTIQLSWVAAHKSRASFNLQMLILFKS